MLEDTQEYRHPGGSCCRITAKNEEESKDTRDNLPDNTKIPSNYEDKWFDKNEPIKSDNLLKELDLKDT
eukprot:11262349-Heterocapsa_arctica.AAC.1